MTIPHRRDVIGIDGRQIGLFIAAALLICAVGVAVVLALGHIVDNDPLTPAPIEETRPGSMGDAGSGDTADTIISGLSWVRYETP